jgi:hypothetical protein
MVAGLRPRIVLGSVAALLVTAVGAYAADQDVAKLTNLTATPNHFCAKKSSSCAHPGTTIHFRLSTPAKVYADIRPRKTNLQGYTEFARRFPAGPNSARINDRRLTPGRWTLKLQPVNSVGANGPTTLDVRVVKSAP